MVILQSGLHQVYSDPQKEVKRCNITNCLSKGNDRRRRSAAIGKSSTDVTTMKVQNQIVAITSVMCWTPPVRPASSSGSGCLEDGCNHVLFPLRPCTILQSFQEKLAVS
jgi:hypothetical protein